MSTHGVLNLDINQFRKILSLTKYEKHVHVNRLTIRCYKLNMLRLSSKVSVANIPIGNPRLISLRYAPYKLLLSGARDTRVVPSGKYTGTQIIWKLTHRIV